MSHIFQQVGRVNGRLAPPLAVQARSTVGGKDLVERLKAPQAIIPGIWIGGPGFPQPFRAVRAGKFLYN
jgi:hypothetical protein